MRCCVGQYEGPTNQGKERTTEDLWIWALVVSFALERVPMLIPQHLTVPVGAPREPKLTRWVAVMARHPDEGTAVVRFPDGYFHWLESQVFAIQDFPYAGMDFRNDPDMVLPQGE